MGYKVLAYSGIETAEKTWPGCEISQDNPPLDAAYDVVYLENLLQQMLRKQVTPAIRRFWQALKAGGKIYIVVPALEWACKEIAAKDEPATLAYPSLFGADGEPHLSGFTLAWLRQVCEEVGFRTETAYSEDYQMELNGTLERGRSNIYVGVKDIGNPADAIEAPREKRNYRKDY